MRAVKKYCKRAATAVHAAFSLRKQSVVTLEAYHHYFKLYRVVTTLINNCLTLFFMDSPCATRNTTSAHSIDEKKPR